MDTLPPIPVKLPPIKKPPNDWDNEESPIHD